MEDAIDGFEDLGNGKRCSKLASKALVFMIKGCCSDWKYIISLYAMSNAATGPQLYNMLLENIDTATEIGLDVSGIVCDQGTSNQRLHSIIFGNIQNVSFIYKDKEIVFPWDYPHLIKSFRNNLFTEGYTVNN